MARYFIEVAYKGTHFKGFQIQEKLLTIQGEINRALHIILKQPIETTTSSRTDAGVHAYQNFLHFNTALLLPTSIIYQINAIVHSDLVIKNIFEVEAQLHSRFDAISRTYCYQIIQHKNPFLKEVAYFFPFKINIEAIKEATTLLLGTHDFTTFAKKHTDVNNHICTIMQAHWIEHETHISFHIEANRFLRGMVRAIVATLLQVGREKLSVADFKRIIEEKENTLADFSAEGGGLFLEKVKYKLPLKSILE